MRPTLRRLAMAAGAAALFGGVFATAATAASAAPASPSTTQVARHDWPEFIDWDELFCWIGLPLSVCDDDDMGDDDDVVLPDDPGDGDGGDDVYPPLPDDPAGGDGDDAGDVDDPGILPAGPEAPVAAADDVTR